MAVDEFIPKPLLLLFANLGFIKRSYSITIFLCIPDIYNGSTSFKIIRFKPSLALSFGIESNKIAPYALSFNLTSHISKASFILLMYLR